MKKKIIFSLLISFTAVFILSLSLVFAWLAATQNTIIITSGPISSEVEGYYEVRISETGDVDDGEDYIKPKKLVSFENINEGVNSIDDISIDRFVNFAFVIKNVSEDVEGTLSVRFANFIDYIFKEFPNYVDGENIDYSDVSKYSGKYTLYISRLYYVYGNDIIIDENNNDNISFNYGKNKEIHSSIDGITWNLDSVNDSPENYIWKYGCGKKFIDNIPLGKKNEENDTITLYFSILSEQSSNSMNDYQNWLYDGTDAYGVRYIVDHYGADEEVAKAFLNQYTTDETNKIIYGDGSGQAAEVSFELNVDYIEFIMDTSPQSQNQQNP